MTITPEALWSFIESSRRATGRVPQLDACVEHFGDRKLNVLMCLGELSPARKDAIRQAVRDQAQADARRRGQRA